MEGKNFISIIPISLRQSLKKNDDFSNIVTNWLVESKLSSEEFKNYSQALSMFTKISSDGTHVILYEIKRNRGDDSIVKKTPLLNSKKAKAKPTSFKQVIYEKLKDSSDHRPTSKIKLKGFKMRIFLLIIVLVVFITLTFIMNSIGGEQAFPSTLDHPFLLRIGNSNPS